MGPMRDLIGLLFAAEHVFGVVDVPFVHRIGVRPGSADDRAAVRKDGRHIVHKLQLTLAAIHELMEVLDDAVKETRDEAR